MSLKPIITGDAVAAFVQSQRPTPGEKITDAALKILWEGIVTILDGDISANAQVTGTVNSGLGAGGSVTGTVS